jgi:hypothetical protein
MKCSRCLSYTFAPVSDDHATCSSCGDLIRVIFDWDLIESLRDYYDGQGDPAYAVQCRLDTRSELVDGIGYALWISLDEFSRVDEIQEHACVCADQCNVTYALRDLVASLDETPAAGPGLVDSETVHGHTGRLSFQIKVF